MDTQILNTFETPADINCLIREAIDIKSKCTSENKSSSNGIDHINKCFRKDKTEKFRVPKCEKALIWLVMNLCSANPQLIDGFLHEALVEYFNERESKPRGLITIDILKVLDIKHAQRDTNLLVWIKYENLLIKLINENIYTPQAFVDDLLVLTKMELDKSLSSKLGSVLDACVKHCRAASNKYNQEGEITEKWCEIIEWISWFVGTEEETFYNEL